jgi:lipopolysaccharide/colanic/teichoic acid biosynthesis glycosyltransferase
MSTSPLAAPLIYREKRSLRRMRRAVDLMLVLLLAIVVVPVIALAAVAILIEDGRPVFFIQRRVGRFERLFSIYKLRTMKKNVGDGLSPTTSSDDRITRVGRFLRKMSIDELPQLMNIINGDMSIIGPRPEMGMILRRYEDWQHMRHLVSPGITCIWQSTVRSTVPLHKPEATHLDLEYIRNASPLLDGAILIRTASSLVSQKGAY